VGQFSHGKILNERGICGLEGTEMMMTIDEESKDTLR
jgi:hypothetical protein